MRAKSIKGKSSIEIKDAWMAGKFSNAELGSATGGNLEIHNLTTYVIALKEK